MWPGCGAGAVGGAARARWAGFTPVKWGGDGDSGNLAGGEVCNKRMGQRPGRIEPRAVKRRPKPFAHLTVPRQVAREQIAKHGHGKKPGLN